jgi:mono/diheme cytochrome c family protein
VTRAILMACALLACSCRGADFERMREQKRVDPYAVTMRTPPAGTIVSDPGPSGAERHSGQMDPWTARSGEHDFHIYCAVCHGDDGAGGGTMAANMPGTRPPSLLTREAEAPSDNELLELIVRGRNRMPRYDWALPADDRRAVIAHLRRLQAAAAPRREAAAR